MIKRIEIDKEYADVLEEVMGDGGGFDWYWGSGTLYKTDDGTISDSKTIDNPQFTHSLVSNNKILSPFYHFFSEMIGIIEKEVGCKIKNLIRIKANLMVKDATYPTNSYNGAHVDYFDENVITFLYYLNDADGDTIFFSDFLSDNHDKKNRNITELREVHRETPKGGTGLLFKSNQLHSSTPPKYTDRRIVINYVLEMENDIKDTQLS
jgi:hypothetical protein